MKGPLSAPARALLALALVFAVGLVFHADGAFYRWDTHGAMLRHASVHGILACGMTLVIVTAGIDLAVGSVLGLSAVVFSLLTIHMGWSAVRAVAAVLGVGVVLGATSGGLVSGFGLQSPKRKELPPWKSIWLKPTVLTTLIKSSTTFSERPPKLNR